MSAQVGTDLPKSVLVVLAALANETERGERRHIPSADADVLITADLARREPDGRLTATLAGRAYLARRAAADGPVDPFRAQHLSVGRAMIATPDGHAEVIIDESESPLAWLARRKGRDGKPLIEGVQFLAGERLRGDFTRANLTPRVTANWDPAVAQGRRGQGGGSTLTDLIVASRERVRHALDAVGPEFSGLLLDVCCFLKGLEDVERERRWPPRSAKVVVQLALDRLARHYGLAGEVRGIRAPIRTWLDADATFAVES
jgi:hypothetical protein